jgi:hypothetical protein
MDESVLASDADRDATVDRLGEAVAQGRLTLGEFAERVDAAYEARTLRDLAPLVGDLPAPAAVVADVHRQRRWTLTLLGDVVRRGPWAMPPRSTFVSLVGDVELDLTQVTLHAEVTRVTLVGLVSDLRLRVPHGVDVDVRGGALLGDRRLATDSPSTRPDAPVIEIRLLAVVGDLTVVRADAEIDRAG